MAEDFTLRQEVMLECEIRKPRCEIDTTTGKKNIMQYANNVATRINEYLDPDSSFFQLGAGKNTIGYNAASGSGFMNVHIEYKMRYLGV